MNKDELSREFVRTVERNIANNTIGAAILLDDNGGACHAGIVVKHNGITRLFHYDPREINEVFFDPIVEDDPYYHKTMSIIPPILVNSYVAQFEIIKENAKPEFGYFYDGAIYKDGVFINEGDMPEYMTCVTFCISCLSGIMKKKYFQFEDWDGPIKGVTERWLNFSVSQAEKAYPNVDAELCKTNLRRIRPIEFVAGAYFSELPIRKINTDSVVTELEDICIELSRATA